MNANNIRKIEDVLDYIEGCLRDFECGIATIEETAENLLEITGEKTMNADQHDLDSKPQRKRVSKGEKYYYITEDLEVSIHFDVNDNTDKSFFRSGNYFITKERAEKALLKIKQAIEEVHNERKSGRTNWEIREGA